MQEIAAGGVVFRRQRGACDILMMEDRFGRWTLPKGRLEAGETPVQAALREIAEETQINGEVVEELAQTRYQYQDSRGIVEKTVYFYLVRALPAEQGGEVAEPVPQPGEVIRVAWVDAGESLRRLGYENLRSVLRKGLDRLKLL